VPGSCPAAAGCTTHRPLAPAPAQRLAAAPEAPLPRGAARRRPARVRRTCSCRQTPAAD
jgi:hypothetical protein